MPEPLVAAPGLAAFREPPAGLPDPTIQPPTIAESGDPFSSLRVVDLLARVERDRPVRLDDIVDALNRTYLDWVFDRAVVTGVVLQLQANWMADYRNTDGIELQDGSYGPTVKIEDSSRVDPWIVRQANRVAQECRERLRSFSQLDRMTGDG